MKTLLQYLCHVTLFLPGFYTQYGVIRDNSLDVNHVLYGDITKMDDMFINPADYDEENSKETLNRRSQSFDSSEVPNIPFKTIAWELISNPFNYTRFEVNDFNVITRSLNNVTRRLTYDDPEDHYSYKEPYKKQQLINAGLQFLVHTRYKLMGAIKQKEAIKYHKKYKLGYLFNRLRRILYETSKIIDQASKQKFYAETRSIFKFYDQVIRYHVDAKDTIELIKVVDAELEDEPASVNATKKSNEEENRL